MNLGVWIGLGFSSKIPARDPKGNGMSAKQREFEKGDGEM